MSNPKLRVPVFDREMARQKEYWVKRLSAGRRARFLEPDYERSERSAGRSERLPVPIPESLNERLTEVAAFSPTMLYAHLIAALKIGNHRYTGGPSTAIGSPALQTADAPGFTNALAIVDDIDEQWSFWTFLANVQTSLAEAYAHQGYPFTRLTQDMGKERQEGRCPLFDIAVVLEGLHSDMPDVGQDITVHFAHSPQASSCYVDYKADLFQPDRLQRFMRHAWTLLESALSRPDARLCELPMITAAERGRAIEEWGRNERPVGPPACVQALFETQVARTPDRVAVVHRHQRLTYRHLNERANQLAHLLIGRGVGPEVLVAIYMDRGVQMLVALLATLKAGGAYVPIDPTYPRQRVDWLVHDSAAPLVLTDAARFADLSETAAEVICLDRLEAETARQPRKNPPPQSAPGNLAYLIYTSGSTGQPKGVMIEQASLSNLALTQADEFAISSESRVVQFASLSFDASVSEIFTALTRGASLHVAERERVTDVGEVMQMLADEGITVATLPPTLLAMSSGSQVQSLATVVSAGEACTQQIVERWSEGRRFINAYGPTETTVCATLYQGQGRGGKAVPIGRPLGNAEVYVLDANLEVAAEGIIGEIYVGGAGVARGYKNAEELTAQRFVANPYGRQAGGRLYRTGDLGRYLSDGQIEFLGRADQQVKVRGYRVELGEIEAALAQHWGVREAVATVYQSDGGEKRLVAYILPRLGNPPGPDELGGFLRERLPGYMVPSVYVPVEEIPLTPNGKVDRAALPSPTLGVLARGKDFQAPRTPIEKQVASIWADLLGIEEVSVNSHFFDLGGHSLLAIQMIARVRDAFNVELPIRMVFNSRPTVEGLAQAIEQFIVEQTSEDELAGMLEELDGLSDDEVRLLLEQEAALEEGAGD